MHVYDILCEVAKYLWHIAPSMFWILNHGLSEKQVAGTYAPGNFNFDAISNHADAV